MTMQAEKAGRQDEVLVDCINPGVAIVRLNCPGKMNALTADGIGALLAALDGIATDASIRVLILTGEGRGFCAGLDLVATLAEDPAAGRDHRTARQWMGLQEQFSGAIRKLRHSDKSVIAAINGAAVGAGMALALAADIRIASRSASFHVGAVRVGLTAGECGISYHLPRQIGSSRAFELMLTGRPVLADEAERIGLVSELVEDAELMERTLDMASLILRNSPFSSRHTKQLMWANLDASSLDAALTLENHAQVLGLMTDDFQEAASAFGNKRPPIFRNN